MLSQLYYKINNSIIAIINFRKYIDNRIICKGHILLKKNKISGKGNLVDIDACRGDIRISIEGCDNKIHIKNSKIINLKIIIEGNKNVINLDNLRVISNTTIVIKDNMNQVIVKSNTGIGGARMVVAGEGKSILIGENCMLSDKIEIWASDTHSILDSSTLDRINHDKSIEIRNHVWIGHNVIIGKGVKIADNSIIGMGSLVTSDVKSNAVYAGNPLRCIRENVTWTIERVM